MRNLLHILFATLLVMVVWPIESSAGPVEDRDSLLREGRSLVYKQPLKTIEIGQYLIETSSTEEEELVATGLIVLGYMGMRDYENVVEYSRRSEVLIANSKNVNLNIQTYNTLGTTYHSLKLYDQAVVYLDEALGYVEKFLSDEQKAFAMGHNHVVRGFVYRDQLGCAVAVPYFDKSIAQYLSISQSVTARSNLSIVYYNKANCQLNMALQQEAIASFEEAITWGRLAETPSLVGFAQKGLAQAYTLNGEYQLSVALLNEALHATEDVGDLMLNQAIYSGLANNHLALGNGELHSYSRQKMLNLRAQIFQNTRNSVIRALEHNTDLQNSAFRQKRTHHVLYVVGLVMGIAALLAFMVVSERRAKRHLATLSSQISAHSRNGH